uniref:Uncharacterized protein n=1 Tax=Calcidiscus leptoporus TaxID=127549 RepID=A0A7S0P1Y8_9EUKA|mmetsp:Transcript_50498/g.116560  ORF Transcript_50498/g.116560 Transcript_50498/m.116560 type:complete len:178 (+) Transcript_50498:8-541(+)|eukprot:CAMPEP_0119374550 /NCGR_PEP_ID=MMETSP1334-20130426/31101_1 /TAXON_ID=127549 /ORGANISM="Calcidiscus leptoporus, Strain RCC1130" /LENGTH=177 /DNA_ID=CAMNT_0007392639 /DNA_START=8 /DNA_END=541 /DNA_ORIENTATION=-
MAMLVSLLLMCLPSASCFAPAAALCSDSISSKLSNAKLGRITLPSFSRCADVIGTRARPLLAKEDGQAGEEEGWTLEKVAKLGIAGVLSIAVAETVFWVLSFPVSELVYFLSTGEYIDLLEQEGQLKFLAFTAGWGAVGGAIAQYRTVLTAAAMTPWMDRTVVQPFVVPLLERFKKE